MLVRELRDAELRPLKGRWYRVTGRLDIGSTIVKLTIGVPWLFSELKRYPPTVICSESWMRQGADWHNGRSMCWIIPDEWRDAMSWKGKPVKEIMAQGRELFLKNVNCLLNRHYVAHLDGMSEWPSEWTFWNHGEEGVTQYRHSRATGRFLKMVAGATQT